LALLVVAVAVAHGVLLDPWLLPTAQRAPAAAPMRTRQIVLPAPAPAAAAAEPAPVSIPAPPLPRSKAQPLASPPLTAEGPPLQGSVEAAALPPTTQHLPTYPTAPSPSTRLHFSVERGSQQGAATLDWSVEDNRYTLRLQAEVDGRPVLGSVSRGAFDPAGLAPERFVETRGRRETRAANYERQAGEITFSGPGHRTELTPGAQDRLSWWLQLAAVLQANPALQEVTLSVTGARADSRVWTFTALPTAADDATGLRHFQRAAQHPYDTEVDVWLDPASHHLPARVRLLFRRGGEATTFTRLTDR